MASPKEKIQSRLEIRQEWQFRKIMPLARRYEASQLEEVYRRLLQADLDIKTGKTSDEMALTLLVAELASR